MLHFGYHRLTLLRMRIGFSYSVTSINGFISASQFRIASLQDPSKWKDLDTVRSGSFNSSITWLVSISPPLILTSTHPPLANSIIPKTGLCNTSGHIRQYQQFLQSTAIHDPRLALRRRPQGTHRHRRGPQCFTPQRAVCTL